MWVIWRAKLENKCLNVYERVEVVEWNKKMTLSPPLLSCESAVFVKENPYSKKKWISREANTFLWNLLFVFVFDIFGKGKSLLILYLFISEYLDQIPPLKDVKEVSLVKFPTSQRIHQNNRTYK